MYSRIWSRPPSERLRNLRPPDFLSASVQATSPQASMRSRRFRENQNELGRVPGWKQTIQSANLPRKCPRPSRRHPAPVAGKQTRSVPSLVFSRRSRVTFLRVMSFRRLVYFRNALQRRGGEGLPNWWAWEGAKPSLPASREPLYSSAPGMKPAEGDLRG